jgi:hypothetical protein
MYGIRLMLYEFILAIKALANSETLNFMQFLSSIIKGFKLYSGY